MMKYIVGFFKIPLIVSSFVIFRHQNRQKAKFQQGDACNLPQNLGQFGIVLAANLLCRLHHPRMFINSLKTLVARGGILVITGPYTWMPEYTDKVSI